MFELKSLTTIAVGGEGEIVHKPTSLEELTTIWKDCIERQNTPIVLGNGSNVIIASDYLVAPVICMKKMPKKLSVNGNRIVVSGGYSLPKLTMDLAKVGLSGLEFGVGIPGLVGGSVFMNAGTGNDSAVGYLVKSVKVLNEQGKVEVLTQKELVPSYRKSSLHSRKVIVVEAEFELTISDSISVTEKTNEILTRKKSSQPYGTKNFGSVYKRGQGYFPGQLIENMGFKGKRFGNVKISDKHANFIVNEGGADWRDVLLAMETIEMEASRFGVELEREVQIFS